MTVRIPEVVLASGSPRRKQLLEEMGMRFRVAPTDADETLPEGASPAEAALVLAGRKACAAAAKDSNALTIAADTLVAVGGRILGKPADESQAVEMLKLLRGVKHEVVTGVCIAYGGKFFRHAERTWVVFEDMTDEDILGYVRTGEPMDKAGAYGIQGRAGEFITGIDGCYFNVMGLPKAALRKFLIQVLGKDLYLQLSTSLGEGH